jgi:hypothetical protein
MPLIKQNAYRVVWSREKPLKHQCLQAFARIANMQKGRTVTHKKNKAVG